MRIFLLLLLLGSACSQGDLKTAPEPSQLSAQTGANSCSEQLETEQDNPGPLKFVKWTYKGPALLASYLLTGLGYTADVVIEVTEGIAVPVLICSPIIIAEIAAETKGHASIRCMTELGSRFYQKVELVEESLGKSAYNVTRGWRCPPVDEISRKMRAMATCHWDKGQVYRAQNQIEVISRDSDLFECLSDQERKKVLELQDKFKT